MGSVVVAGARTPVGKLLGALSGRSAVELGAAAIAGALDRAGLAPGQVDYVIMGQVLQAGCGQLPARQAAARAGIPMTVPALSINKVCLSGLHAVALADSLIRAGTCEVVVAGGMESMSQAPHLLTGSRSGFRYGEVTMLDHLAHDGLEDAFTDQPMGALTDAHDVGDVAVSRADADAFAARSHQRALAATRSGVLAEEIVPVRVPQRRGPDLVVDADEGIREGVTTESLSRLAPAFSPTGSVTAGSASPLSDGAAALVVASREAAERLRLPVLAEIGAHASVAGPDSSLQLQPANAVALACAQEGVAVADLDRVEINEAFAAVGVASARALGLTAAEVEARVNVHGGSVALGHPIGASGARLVLTLALELARRGGGTGVAALCGGGGQGEALLLRVPAPDRGAGR
ncbi:MAG: 3-ketoacyl-CoA thiolase @ Acetyl-CoA acetyltransferase [uncultured Friedmanniella sp.]|uniref:Probable acetyl-CoA acetyltransferase n=1 Tax=uncultured Friedmanniella sp. TaxID=335381 RepID=A0A6J4JZM0_9ACTN|nr:acetyl-CoA C-acyltransferase [uncultured Friedmanniella sp.]CAA9291876.1 MAG: 3-ketoacyl-CoA thiolase @ Acetyl-CoA acetyltransferase [uncultured Friedmanniella sp.]